MIRTQVYLDDHQPNIVRKLAQINKRSQSDILREALEIGLKKMQEPKKGNAEVFLGLAELGKKLKIKAEPNFSSKIDDFLYGNDSKQS